MECQDINTFASEAIRTRRTASVSARQTHTLTSAQRTGATVAALLADATAVRTIAVEAVILTVRAFAFFLATFIAAFVLIAASHAAQTANHAHDGRAC